MTDVPDHPIKQHTVKKAAITGQAKATKKVIKHSVYASPLGNLVIQHNGHSIQHIRYLNIDDNMQQALVSPLPLRWQALLNSYFCGDFSTLDHLPVRLDQGTEFQQQVWLALRKIKAGHTCSYKELANHIKRPNAIRAVGQALSRNPVVIVLPCHRVIQQSGALGGYEGKLAASNGRKQFLLWHEGADVLLARHKSNIDQI